MALKTRRDFFSLDVGIHTEQIYPSSRLLTNIIGLQVPPNKAIVGANAFAHEAGIHQDGVLKEKTTYEIMRPETVGITQSTLVLGQALRPPRLSRPDPHLGVRAQRGPPEPGLSAVQGSGRQEEAGLRRRHRGHHRRRDPADPRFLQTHQPERGKRLRHRAHGHRSNRDRKESSCRRRVSATAPWTPPTRPSPRSPRPTATW